MFQSVCKKVFQNNEEYRKSVPSDEAKRRDGSQYVGYVTSAVRTELDAVSHE
ncbi:hypothetical protein HYV57_01330 [Candidatus Peregrinibacteria bacterium]|nr:hypothetical protein [Candidatus Peregrinibacteria bacterium]